MELPCLWCDVRMECPQTHFMRMTWWAYWWTHPTETYFLQISGLTNSTPTRALQGFKPLYLIIWWRAKIGVHIVAPPVGGLMWPVWSNLKAPLGVSPRRARAIRFCLFNPLHCTWHNWPSRHIHRIGTNLSKQTRIYHSSAAHHLPVTLHLISNWGDTWQKHDGNACPRCVTQQTRASEMNRGLSTKFDWSMWH